MDPASELFRGVSPATVCWMSHNDYIEAAAPGSPLPVTPQIARSPQWNGPKKAVCRAIPPRSVSHTRGQQNAGKLCARRVRLRGRLEDGFLCGGFDLRHPPKGGEGQGAVRPFPAGGQQRGRGNAGKGRGQTADLRVCGSWPAAQKTRPRRCARSLDPRGV